METSGFFSSELVGGVEDRAYIPEQFSEYFANFVSNGYFANPTDALQVVNPTGLGMTPQIKAGAAFINGFWYKNSSTLLKTLDAADGLLPRIDAIVVRKTVSTRETKIFIKKGTPASSPVAPTVTRDGNVYELMLATIYIAAGTLNITNANITDTRMNESVCGVVKGLIEEIQTNDLFAQFTDAFNIWFNTIKNQLTADVAGSLQNQINIINTNAGGWKIYNSVTDIGSSLSLGSSTMIEIANAMQSNSIIRTFIANAETTSNADIPTTNAGGYLEIVKTALPTGNAKKIFITFYSVINTMYTRTSITGTGSDLGAWRRLIDDNDAGYTYSAVAELGLNAATCTLADIWNAMAASSELFVDLTALTNIASPAADRFGVLEIKKFGFSRGSISYIPKIPTGLWYMGINSSNLPDGVWKQYVIKDDLGVYATKTELGSYATNAALGAYATKTELGTQVAVQPTAPADGTKLWVW